ncbi:MFS transporter [Candidatus Spongiihabitans sp.]|uniref:MFS transporter n=1 Tax=Candidatus Spongiihabitans sp. TaxID=3101308 RepID=UPI003C7D2CEB
MLFAAAILLAGNGLQSTLVALRANAEGFDTQLIGLMGAAYFCGFLSASFLALRLIQAFGHIRVFAALAAIGAVSSLALVLIPNPYYWVVIRGITGFCFSGLLMVIESWINESVSNTYRGQVMSIYRIVDLTAVTGAQFLLPLVGFAGFELFAIVAIMFCLSLVPVSLSNRSRPKPPDGFKFDFKTVWQISPLACLGTLTIGLTNSAFRMIGPIYATEIGFDTRGVVLFMTAGIIGGAVMQYPLGYLSDKLGRRKTVLMATLGAVLAGLFMSFFAGNSNPLVYAGSFMFGAFAFPLYSLSTAHANDRAQPGQFVVISAGLTFFFALGAIVGPYMASVVITQFGVGAFFIYTSFAHGLLICVVLFRMARTASVPADKRRRFAELLHAAPDIFRLSRKRHK